MNLLVMGMGYVGVTTAIVFARLGWTVTGIDPNQTRIDLLNQGVLPFYEPGLDTLLSKYIQKGNLTFISDLEPALQSSQVIFLCVGTPSHSDGSADLQYIKQAAESIGKRMHSYKLVVIKSTVPPGTNEKMVQWITNAQPLPLPFDVISNPEFLREGSALQDALQPDRIIIGSVNGQATRLLQTLYEKMNVPIFVTKPKTAEMIKYASNSFLAAKISYMNELARLCAIIGVNISDVAKGMGMDHRIGKHFLQAGIGYGGSCFPKDINALLFTAKEHEMNLMILEKVMQINQTQYLHFLNNWELTLGSYRAKTIGVLGISFKPDTDDIREAPSISIIETLLQRHAIVKVHDPAAKLPVNLMSGQVQQFDSLEETVKGCDAVILCSEWEQYKTADWALLKASMKQPYLFDGRNALDREQLTEMGFYYRGIGNQ